MKEFQPVVLEQNQLEYLENGLQVAFFGPSRK